MNALSRAMCATELAPHEDVEMAHRAVGQDDEGEDEGKCDAHSRGGGCSKYYMFLFGFSDVKMNF